MDGGEVEHRLVGFDSAPPAVKGLGEVPVQVGECLEEALGVAGRQPGVRRRVVAQALAGRPQHLAGPVEPLEHQRIGLFLAPLETPGFTVDPDRQRVLLVDRDLRGVEDAAGAAREAQEHVAVVLQRPAVDERGQVGAQGLDAKPGDRLGEVLGVRSDVADAATDAGALRVGAPVRLLLALRFEFGGEPALRILDDDLAHPAELTAADPVPGLLDHRIAGVVVGQAEDEAGPFDCCDQGLGLGRRLRHRLVAHHVEAGFERRPGDRKVHVVRGDDGDEVHALGRVQGGLALHHLLVGAVAAVGRQEEIGAGGPGAFRVRAEGAADELDQPVETGRHPVNGADESALAAADHAHADLPFHRALPRTAIRERTAKEAAFGEVGAGAKHGACDGFGGSTPLPPTVHLLRSRTAPSGSPRRARRPWRGGSCRPRPP